MPEMTEVSVVVDNDEKVQELKGTAEDVAGLDGSIAGEMMSFFTAPVAGGTSISILYFLTMLASMAIFISSLVTAAPKWAEPITSVKTELAESIPFPDVYMCYDADFAALLEDEFLEAKILTFNGCQGLTAAPSLSQLMDIKAHKCFIKTTECSIKDLPIDTEDGDKKGTLTAALNDKAKQLANLIPKIDGQTADAFCFHYPGKGATISRTEAGQLAFLAWKFKPVMEKMTSDKYFEIMSKGQFSTLYLAEQGAEVVDIKNNKTLVTGAMFPAFGTISVATIEADQVKDELAGDTRFHWRYRAGVTPILEKSSHYYQDERADGQKVIFKDNSWIMAPAFNIFSFNVNKVHIRSMTFGEIWAQIGGLWGGAVLIMSLIFTGSGFIRRSDQKELQVFRYQSIKTKKAAIQNAGGFNKGEEAKAKKKQEKKDMEDRVAKLEAKNAKLEAKIKELNTEEEEAPKKKKKDKKKGKKDKKKEISSSSEADSEASPEASLGYAN